MLVKQDAIFTTNTTGNGIFLHISTTYKDGDDLGDWCR